MISRKFLILTMLLAIPLLCAGSGSAEQKAARRESGPQVEAPAVLMWAADFLSQVKQFSVSIRAGYDVLQKTGQKIEFNELRNVTLARPDRMRVDVEQSDGDRTLILFDGEKITVSDPEQKTYAIADGPGDVDHAILFFLNDLRLKFPLAMMFVTKLPSELESRVRSVSFVERDDTMDVPCIHLAARTDEVDFQIWIPSQDAPLPRRVVITYKNEPGQPQFRADFSNWNLSPNLPQGFFTFTPPGDARQIPFLAQVKAAKAGVREAEKGGRK